MGGVQCCEPEMRKVDLCPRSLHFLRKPTGGGKVLSLILAGTLALGMTPAAALTQAAMDVTPAYAVDAPTTLTLPDGAQPGTLENWNDFATGEQYAGSTVTLAKVTNNLDLTYTGANIPVETKDFSVVVMVDPADGDDAYFTITKDMFTIKEGEQSAGPTINLKNAGDSTITLAPAGTTDVTSFGENNTTTVNVKKASVTVAFPEDQVLGVATPKTIHDAVVRSVVPNTLKEMIDPESKQDYTVTLTDSKGVVLDNDNGDVFTEPTTVTVQVALEDSAKDNCTLGEDGTATGTVEVAAAAEDEGTYAFEWSHTSGDVTPVKPAGDDDPVTVGTVNYKGTALKIDGDISATFQSSESNATAEPVNVKSFDITWIDNTRGKQALAAGTQPVIPGSYTAEFRPKGTDASAEPVGTLTLKVVGDLSTQVSKDGAPAATPTKPIIVTVNGQAPTDEIKLQYKEGITEKDVVDQIVAGLGMAFETTGSATDKLAEVENPTELFEFNVTDFVANKTGKGGTVAMRYKGSDGAFTTDPLVFTYAYGKDLPQAPALDAVTYFPGGYKVSDLIPEIKGEDGTIVKAEDVAKAGGKTTNYVVKAYDVNDEGKEVAVETLTDVGTYKVTVEPDPDGPYVGDVQTLSLTINPVTVTAKNATFTWDNKNTVNGTFSVSYTGGPAEPEPGVVVEWQTAPTGAADSEEKSATLSTDGPENKIVTKEVYDAAKPEVKKTYAAYVEYADNTAVTDNGAKATLTFVNNYAGVKEQTFSIKAADIAKLDGLKATAASQMKDQFNTDGELNVADVVDPVVKFRSDGTEANPVYTELEQGTDYRITRVWPSSKTSSTKGVTIYNFEAEGRGNYTGTCTGEFRVTTQDLGQVAVASLADKDQKFFYDTNEKTPGVVVNLKGATADKPGAAIDASQYDVAYKDNVNAGTATATITGTGDYAGTLEVQFEIQPLKLDGAKTDKMVLSGAEGLVYNGKAFEPEVVWSKSKLTLADRESVESNPIPLSQYVDDLKFTYENNVNASTAEAPAYVVIEGKNGNFTGTAKVPFAIAQADIAKATVEAAPVAPGGDLADAVKVTLGETVLAAGTDYTVTAAEGATVPGTVSATIAGIGNYTGEVKKDVAVLYDVAGLDYQVSSGTYNGQSQTPVVTASYKDAAGKTVEVPASALNVAAGSYVNAGTYKIKVAGNNAAGWGGETSVSYAIAPATVTAKPQVSYAGGLPVVTVPGLTSNDFDWKADAATKTITVTYKGNYKGTAKVAYTPTVAPSDPGSAQPAAGKTGWVGSGNDWAYYENGQAVKGGWKLIGGEWYHFEKSGKMTNTKWFQDADGEWYLLNQSHKGSYGAMLTGWQKADGGWYYMGSDGAMESGWLKDTDGTWYLLNSKHDGTFGKMLTGWQKVGGKWYYMDASGAMASNTWVGRYWVDGSGVWTATR
ncbi:hypothetical protein GMI70_01205 [Eggerthellaceae bacterium zg-893]|nr:hypothetical protein [Eggerthellaceae bacterium zg-893]